MNSKKSVLEILTSWKMLVIALLIAGIAITAATFVAKGNADYICTRIIEDESACAIDEWSDWADINGGDPEAGAAAGATYEVVQRRVGTGTKILSRVIEYLNLRTACQAGYTSAGNGGRGGASGFHGGRTFTQSAVCQINETRTVARTVPGDPNDPEGGATNPPDVVIGDIETEETSGDITTTGGDEVDFGTFTELNDFRRSMIKAEITAVPSLVTGGTATEVRWGSRETTECRVSGDNGDVWDVVRREAQDGVVGAIVDARTSGVETTSLINGRVVYTLTCKAFDGSSVTANAIVDRIPVFQEI